MKGMTGWLALGIAAAGLAGAQSAVAAEADLVSYEDDAMELYRPVLDQYNTALLEQWSMQEYAAAGLCALCAYYTNPSQVGYWLEDVDNNGTEELLVGETEAQGEAGGMIFQLYAVYGQTPVLIASSTENSRYYLCTDGIIAKEEFDGAESLFAYYMADSDNAVLTLTEAVIYDGTQEGETPWFYSRTGTDVSDAMPVFEADAIEIMDSHEHEAIEYLAFADYGI
ncbi:MAG: hypothetical protein Q4E91_02665 [Lachnospiraceae bacterium]|nr:hypothetical protein [Lachnospiraceae bacterium]